MSLFGVPEWRVYRGKTFEAGLSFYAADIVRKGAMIDADDEDVRRHMLRKFHWALISKEIEDFTARKTDPEGILPLLHEKGDVIPDTHYIRVGTFYSVFERDVVNKSIYQSLFYSGPDRLRWLKQLALEPDQRWKVLG